MPLAILTTVLGYVFGRTIRRPAVAYALTATGASLSVFQMIWAVADGRGHDPGWLVAVAMVFGAAALGLTRFALGHRARIAS